MENNIISENNIETLKIIILICGEMAKILNKYLDLQDTIVQEICGTFNARTSYCMTQKPPIIVKILNGDFSETKANIRITPQSFHKLLEFIPDKRHGWAKEIELIVFLFWLGCGTSYRVVSKAMVMPKNTVKNIIHKYLIIFEKLSVDVVQRTPPVAELEEIGIKFASKARSWVFCKAAGAIDGCHIKVKCPPNQRDQYINRKLDYSIQLQAVCDHNYKIINMCVGYPGSVHDQRVLTNSQLYRSGKYPPDGYFLLGDAGYKCIMNPIAIITPYKGYTLTERQTRFNHALWEIWEVAVWK